MELEREPEAVPWFEKATVLEPKSAENHYWLGNAHGAIAQKAGVSFKGMGAIRKGRSAWEKAIELDPKHLGARQTLILFFLAAPGIAGGSVDKARDQAKAVAGFNPVEGHLAQARIARYEKKPADAEKELDAALALSPSNTAVLAQRGLLRAEMKKFDLALADLRRWRELAPKNRLAIYQIGRLAALSGQGFGGRRSGFEGISRVRTARRRTRQGIGTVASGLDLRAQGRQGRGKIRDRGGREA